MPNPEGIDMSKNYMAYSVTSLTWGGILHVGMSKTPDIRTMTNTDATHYIDIKALQVGSHDALLSCSKTE